ncbi:MAG: hypothetical protein MUC85_12880 [Anaerolineales bacterium]|jgi:hypothetical protein|nr:hypothetical protein [Anaerolineales bacterium]
MILSEKLQLKPGQQILVQNPPAGNFEHLMVELPQARLEIEGADALLLFITSLAEVADLTPGAIQKIGQTGLLWIAYPKGGSGVKTDVNRDRLAAAVVESIGWRAVRQVAIDEVWSALRFRPIELVGR